MPLFAYSPDRAHAYICASFHVQVSSLKEHLGKERQRAQHATSGGGLSEPDFRADMEVVAAAGNSRLVQAGGLGLRLGLGSGQLPSGAGCCALRMYMRTCMCGLDACVPYPWLCVWSLTICCVVLQLVQILKDRRQQLSAAVAHLHDQAHPTALTLDITMK